jgi:hypothetical protein
MKLWTLWLTFCVGVQLLFINSCDRRRFKTEQAAVRQFRAHQDAYRALAEDWLASGHRRLAWFGRSSPGQESYFWNDYSVTPSGQRWEVMHPGPTDYIVQTAESFDETAKICGVSGGEVLKWRRRLATLGADKVTTVSRFKDGRRFNYVEIGYLPLLYGNGFFFAPTSDHAAQEVLQSWAQRNQHPGHRVVALDEEWFYYEGYWGT